MKCGKPVTSGAWTWHRIAPEPFPVHMKSDSTARPIQSLCGTPRAAAKGSRWERSKRRDGLRASTVFTSSLIFFSNVEEVAHVYGMRYGYGDAVPAKWLARRGDAAQIGSASDRAGHRLSG